jgi:hypothetical protein
LDKALLRLPNPAHEALKAESHAREDLSGNRIVPVNAPAVLYGYSDTRTEAY